jgi:hypothetical protein
MSYFGSKEQAKKDAMAGDMQIDDLTTTSPVGAGGGMEAGGAPMKGRSEFTNDRTRPTFVGNQGGPRREWPTEGVSSKSGV